MSSHSNQEQPKENVTVLVIMVLMFIIIAPIIGMIGKNCSCNNECKKPAQHENSHAGEHKADENHNNH